MIDELLYIYARLNRVRNHVMLPASLKEMMTPALDHLYELASGSPDGSEDRGPSAFSDSTGPTLTELPSAPDDFVPGKG